jgi:nucleoside-diphosphate-sugar epimerase
MRVGVIGLGHVGFPIAKHLHALGYELYSWSRSEKNVSWKHSVNFGDSVEVDLDVLFIASGATKPNFGDFKIEIESTLDLASKFRLLDSTRLVYISSGAVYGDCPESVSESSEPRPSTNYGSSKLVGEKAMKQRFGNNLTILRLGNLISEADPFGMVQQLMYAHQRGFIDFFGLPEDCRDYLDISDFLICVERLIGLKNPPKILNLGSGFSISLGEIAQLLRFKLNKGVEERWSDRKSWDLPRTKLDVLLMEQILRISPKNPKLVLEQLLSTLDGAV